LVRLERIPLLRVAQGVADHSLLAVIKHGDATQPRFNGV